MLLHAVVRITIAAATLVAALLCVASPALAMRVYVLRGQRVEVRNERVAGRADLPARRAHLAESKWRASRRPGAATRKAVDRLLARSQIDQATHDQRLATLRGARRAYARLIGVRRAELGSVIANADAIARSHQLTPSRLPAIFATLAANHRWWMHGRLLAPGARVSVGRSPLLWQYYPGQGIELQMLANFGRANALWSAKDAAGLRSLLDALIPLAADRGGWPAWEYYFRFGGGKPPWTSAISQGTAVQVLGRAGQLLGDPSLTALGEQALGAFEQPPPAGVRVATEHGPFYVIYSYAPRELVINAELQALVGLYDFGQITGDARAQNLFAEGNATAEALLPRYDTGAWSLYDQKHESDLNYHKLVTTFLHNLCKRMPAETIYCDTAARFRSYLDEAPTVSVASQRVRARARAELAFSLDKISRVGVSVLDSDSNAVFATSAVVGRGWRTFAWSRPAKPGLYTLRVRATDLAGNLSAPAEATLRILSARKRRRR